MLEIHKRIKIQDFMLNSAVLQFVVLF